MLHESSIKMSQSGSFKQYPVAPRPSWKALIGATAVSIVALGSTAMADEPSAELIAKGRYIATASDCAACHTAPHGGTPFAGGYGISSPLGTIFSTNITPSKADGIGNYSEEEFAHAVRDGVAKDGSHLYPAMPYTAYAKMTDEDVRALYAYFMHEVKPVDHQPQKTELPFPFSVRTSMAAWNLLFLDKTRFTPDASKSTEWNRGAYLSEALAHCSTCHTPRNDLMAEQSSKALSGGSLGSWYAPNITSDPVSGIGDWSQEELVQYLRTGHVAGKAQAAGPMAEAIEHSLQHLTDDDLNAIAVYVKDVAPISSGDKTPRDKFGKPSVTEYALRGLPGEVPNESGFRIFSGVCANCHQMDGEGNKHYPSLFHNTVTGADRSDNLLSAIVFGVNRTVDGHTAYMPGFGPDAFYTDRLSDQDVADVSNYVLAQYGNPDVKVTPADVKLIREGGPKPLIAELAPFAAPAMVVGILILIALIVWLVRRRKRAAHA
ncbi:MULTISPECIES: c-type cytochrome [unclassified Ochrobactrum]|uniref:c-type cytochrome n=1 Tax=unclassified Ochrobactrum TaxID=239106 RepID=UPI0030B36F4E